MGVVGADVDDLWGISRFSLMSNVGWGEAEKWNTRLRTA